MANPKTTITNEHMHNNYLRDSAAHGVARAQLSHLTKVVTTGIDEKMRGSVHKRMTQLTDDADGDQEQRITRVKSIVY